MLAVVASIVIGPVEISWYEIYAVLDGSLDTSRSLDVLIEIRLPRALSALAIGATLGLSGALTQALFRNPLADPITWNYERSRTGYCHCDGIRIRV